MYSKRSKQCGLFISHPIKIIEFQNEIDGDYEYIEKSQLFIITKYIRNKKNPQMSLIHHLKYR